MHGVIEAWTEGEILKIRRCIAYHQKRSLRMISRDEALAILDEQQRRRDRLYGDGNRNYLNGWLCTADEGHPCAAQRKPTQDA